jgi:hypothetical protein
MSKRFDAWCRRQTAWSSITWVKKAMTGRQDSFWYDGEVAFIGGLSLIANGEIRMYDRAGNAAQWEDVASDCKTDRGMRNKLGGEGDGTKYEFVNNNWFEVIGPNGDACGDVCSEYDEGLSMLLFYAECPQWGNLYISVDN